MKNLNGIIYYNLRESGYLLNISHQTLRNYIKFNKELKSQKRELIVPEPIKINKTLHYSMEDIKKIREAMRRFKRGDFLEFKKEDNTYDKLKKKIINLKNEER